MTRRIVDLDKPGTWPEPINSEITARLDALIAERTAQNQHDLSGERWLKPSPPSPNTEHVLRTINDSMNGCDLRVFHATRLLDAEVIKREGLRLLVLKERMTQLRGLTTGALSGFADRIDDLISQVDLTDPFFSIREGRVWATPLRRYLHDGGCDVFFDHWGGEAVQRFASMASRELETAIQNVGAPAVVVFRMPAFGFCEGTELRLAPTILELALETSGKIELHVGGWDVRSQQPVPPDWIEDVLPPNHPSLA